MNENIDLIKILKNCPEGFNLYSSIVGCVTFGNINLKKNKHPIIVYDKEEREFTFSKNGKYFDDYDGECCLFPSKEQRDWSKFSAPYLRKERFDPKTLKAFDRVIVYSKDEGWFCTIFSHIGEGEYPYNTASGNYEWCIPYNDETKHLVGTTGEAPEYYKYWED